MSEKSMPIDDIVNRLIESEQLQEKIKISFVNAPSIKCVLKEGQGFTKGVETVYVIDEAGKEIGFSIYSIFTIQ